MPDSQNGTVRLFLLPWIVAVELGEVSHGYIHCFKLWIGNEVHAVENDRLRRHIRQGTFHKNAVLTIIQMLVSRVQGDVDRAKDFYWV